MSMNPRKGTVTPWYDWIRPVSQTAESDEHESSEGDCDFEHIADRGCHHRGQMSMNPRKGTVTHTGHWCPHPHLRVR